VEDGMRKTKDKPYVDNYPPLRDWLRKHEMRCDWQIPLGDAEDPSVFVECYHAPRSAHPIIVCVNANGHGWNLYTPSASTKIDETLADAERRLGL
jgi:hypothetical protein